MKEFGSRLRGMDYDQRRGVIEKAIVQAHGVGVSNSASGGGGGGTSGGFFDRIVDGIINDIFNNIINDIINNTGYFPFKLNLFFITINSDR